MYVSLSLCWAPGAVALFVRLSPIHFLSECRKSISLVLSALVVWVSCVVGLVCQLLCVKWDAKLYSLTRSLAVCMCRSSRWSRCLRWWTLSWRTASLPHVLQLSTVLDELDYCNSLVTWPALTSLTVLVYCVCLHGRVYGGPQWTCTHKSCTSAPWKYM